MSAPTNVEPREKGTEGQESIAELLTHSRSKRNGAPQIDRLGALEKKAREQYLLTTITSSNEKEVQANRQKMIAQGQMTGLSKEESVREVDAEIATGRSLKSAKPEDRGKILQLYESGASSKQILDQMSLWGYSDFVKQEMARLSSYKATELRQQMALFEVSGERTDAAQYAREFALSLRELTRYNPESSYKDELERYAGMLDGISAMGKEVKMDGKAGKEIKDATLEITRSLDKLLSSVVAEGNRAVEATVKDTARLSKPSRHKLTKSELPQIKMKPADERLDGKTRREDVRIAGREKDGREQRLAGKMEPEETLTGQIGGIRGRREETEALTGQKGGIRGRKEEPETVGGQVGGIKGKQEPAETLIGQRGGIRGRREETETLKGQKGGITGKREPEEILTGQRGGIKGRQEPEEILKGQRGGIKGTREETETQHGQIGGVKGKQESEETIGRSAKEYKAAAKRQREMADQMERSLEAEENARKGKRGG